MTRETKLGLMVAGTFLALVGGVVTVRLRQADAPAFEDAMRAAGLPPGDFTGRDGARSAPGGDRTDVQPGNGGTSPPPNPRAALRDRAWRMRRQLNA